MQFKTFINLTKDIWEGYFQRIKTVCPSGLTSKGFRIVYPTHLLITQNKNHYIAELFGSSKEFNGLNVKSIKPIPTNIYLGQFDKSEHIAPMFVINNDLILSRMLLSRTADFEPLEKRFPFMKNYETRFVKTVESEGSLFAFDKFFELLALDNSLLVNRYENIFRVKNISHLTVISKDLSSIKYFDFYKDYLKNLDDYHGFTAFDSKVAEDLILAGQLVNIYLFPNMNETMIVEFLKTHPKIIKQALGSKNFLSEASFPWLEGNPDSSEKTIRPDLMIERDDGFYDIYDLKTALINKNNITKGKHKRRNFIEYVEDGIAQLANYEDYFNFPKNRDYALKEYGVKVKSPNLVLVVGNYDNVDKSEVKEACRKLKGNISIIDYETLLQMFLYTSIKNNN